MSLNLLAGESMKSGVSPRSHPLDQFRRDHPLLEQQGQDLGLEEVPQDGGVEEGGVDKTAVRLERSGGSQDVQVGMPVQKLITIVYLPPTFHAPQGVKPPSGAARPAP
jgi:hypothetical protein